MKILQRSTSDDIFKNEEKLYGLFLSFPFKDFQQKVQQIDKKLLGFFFLNDLKIKIGKRMTWCFEVVDGENPLAFFVMEPQWKHSEIYGKKMFQISTVVNYLKPEPCFNLFWSELMKTIRCQNIEHLSCRLDASDYRNIALFTHKGFRYSGVSLKKTLPLNHFSFSANHRPVDLSVKVRIANFLDLSQILEISRQHKQNHVVYDVFLDESKAGRLFSDRVRDFFGKIEARIYALKRDNETLGFVSYLEPVLFNITMNKKITTLDLVVIDDKHRGKNFGTYLLARSLINESYLGFKEAELRVASDNYPALSLYAALGFRIVSGDTWLSYEPKQ